MHAYGSIHSVPAADRLIEEVDALALSIAAKVPAVVRAMKGAINRSTERDLVGKYRAEASYTYELHMSGAAAAARRRVVGLHACSRRRHRAHKGRSS